MTYVISTTIPSAYGVRTPPRLGSLTVSLLTCGLFNLLPPPSGVSNLVTKGYKKISPFFIPYAITNMGGALLAIDQVRTREGAGGGRRMEGLGGYIIYRDTR